MNYTAITLTLVIFSLFSGTSLLINYIVDDFSKNKPTEESYLKSERYAITKLPYDVAMENYDKEVNFLSPFGIFVQIMAFVMSGMYYFGIANKGLQNNDKVSRD